MRMLTLEVSDEVELSDQDLKTMLLAHLYENGVKYRWVGRQKCWV